MLRLLLISALLLIATVPPSIGLAMEPLRDPSQLWDAKPEMMKRVTGAKVLLADYPLIRHDFEETATMTNEQIDSWLIENTSFISIPQTNQTQTNDKINTTDELRRAYRPREYRRAIVFQTNQGSLIDAKGTGAIDPSGGSHDNGLATLGDMVREFAYEKLVHAIFKANDKYDTVGSYAVIDYGFDIKHTDGGRSRAGTILRQAHARHHSAPIGQYRSRGQSTMLPRETQLGMETLLRHYGLSSTIPSGAIDLINIQGAEDLSLVDFGSFLTRKTFVRSLGYFYDSHGEPIGEVVLQPNDKNFVQPDFEHAIPFEIWGYSQTGREDSKYDNPYIWSHELAEAIRTGKATRADAEQHLRNMFDNAPTQSVLTTVRTCEALFAG